MVLRFLFAIAAKKQLRIRQLDAVTTFLNEELSDEIYMLQPEKFNDGSGPVSRSLYGLKQASRAWNEKLNQVLLDCGLNRSEADPCVVYHFVDGEKVLLLAVYVDNMLMFSNQWVLEGEIVEKLKS